MIIRLLFFYSCSKKKNVTITLHQQLPIILISNKIIDVVLKKMKEMFMYR
jgi:hypothetical protein